MRAGTVADVQKVLTFGPGGPETQVLAVLHTTDGCIVEAEIVDGDIAQAIVFVLSRIPVEFDGESLQALG